MVAAAWMFAGIAAPVRSVIAYETASSGESAATSQKNAAEPTASTARISAKRTRRCSGRVRRARSPETACPARPRRPCESGAAAAAAASASVGIASTSTRMRSGSVAAASGSISTVRSRRSRAIGMLCDPTCGSPELRDDSSRPASRKRLPASPSTAADTNPGAARAEDERATASVNSCGMWTPSSWSNIRMTIRRFGLSSVAASAAFRLPRSSSLVRTSTDALVMSASRRVRGTRGSPTTSRTPCDVRCSSASVESPMATTTSSRNRSSSTVRRPR